MMLDSAAASSAGNSAVAAAAVASSVETGAAASCTAAAAGVAAADEAAANSAAGRSGPVAARWAAAGAFAEVGRDCLEEAHQADCRESHLGHSLLGTGSLAGRTVGLEVDIAVASAEVVGAEAEVVAVACTGPGRDDVVHCRSLCHHGWGLWPS